MAKEIAEEYTSSLADLTLNSKPLINMLTMLADDNVDHAKAIVEAVEKHLDKVRSEYKLPVLYLIDSIVKNVGRAYTTLFTQNIVNSFCSVFEKVDEKIRAQMFKLRQTWTDVFPTKKLYALDVRVQCIDPAWPITAPHPTPSIHVNPKFFNKPSGPKVQLDQSALDMQAQLINKQKELLELKQKKLELELLQAKAKLEEQQKQLEKHTVQIKNPQHSLLKPEVAKQLAKAVPTDTESFPPVKNLTQAFSVNNAPNTTRIAPVSSALASSVRPTLRDPRLLRQQQSATVTSTVPIPSSIVVPPSQIASNIINNVNLDEKHKIKSKLITTVRIDCASNNAKASVNKTGAQSNNLSRKDPRLLSNKVPGSSAINKTKSNNGRPSSKEHSPSKTKTSPNLSRKSNKLSSTRSFKSTIQTNESDTSSNNTSKVVKNNSNNKSSSELSITNKNSTSPIKYKKKSESSEKSVVESKRTKLTNKSDAKSGRSRDKYDDETNQTESPLTLPVTEQRTFKDLKGSTKNRNYMRRNRAVSPSPEPVAQDVDLRIKTAASTSEIQPRLSTESVAEDVPKSSSIDDRSTNKDVDLRTLVVPAAVNKKRSSTEKLEAGNAKKSKTQLFDVLFGNEDVDLRQIPSVLAPVAAAATPQAVQQAQSVIRPPTPPPPIISTVPIGKLELKEKTKTNLDAIRAKLANATKTSVFSDESRKNLSEDTDMRLTSAEDMLQKIIISQADEQLIRNGNLSQALVEKVLTLFETQKLKEAQRRESEEMNVDNRPLTPISDGEMSSIDFSHSESEDESKIVKKPSSKSFGDTDDRVPPPAPVISQNNSLLHNSQPEQLANKSEPRLVPNSRLPPQVWQSHVRKRRPKTHWDNPPLHQGPEPWLRPPPAVLYGPRRSFPPFIRPEFRPRIDEPIHIMMDETSRTASPPTIGSQTTKELPLADPLVLEYIEQDTMRTINIDGRPREIRYYDETAVVILSWDDPREISFQNGTRLITFDDKESFTLSFNEPYKNITIDGRPHRIRLGGPTREFYIDNKWYECFFGGPGIGIEVDGKMKIVKMDGPAPHVKIGNTKRTDLVAGKINLIINARQMVPVFLDAKPQKFDIEGKIHTLRFVDALRTVLINEVPFKVEFGGLPKPITVHDKKHFIRFSVLPRGIRPGYVNILNMEGNRQHSPVENEKEVKPDSPPLVPVENIANNISVNEPALPMLGKRRIRPTDRESPDSSRNSPIPILQQIGSLDVLSSIMTSSVPNSSNVSGYNVDTKDPNLQDSQDGFQLVSKSDEVPVLSNATDTESATPAANPFIPSNLNINELFQKLVESGIVTSVKEKSPPPPKEEAEIVVKTVSFLQPETLKIKQFAFVSALYSGMQCSSCGVRFPLEHSVQYSQHLDWHFRQNRRGKNSSRKALFRKWYYTVSDWKNFEEIEDLEEREKNWFESQQQQLAEGVEDGDEEIEIPSVPADNKTQENRCEVCHDKFDQFYNEEKEEWHLRMAIRVDNKTYHPLCYDDYKASLINTTLDESTVTVVDNKETTIEIVEPSVEEITEIKEDTNEAQLESTKEEEKMEVEYEDDDDDDVVIQEPHIEQIEIDDKMDDNEVPFPVIIKQEPIDDDMPSEICITNIKTEPLDSEVDDPVQSIMRADTTHAEVLSSIDGNVQLSSEPPISGSTNVSGKIKINITKPIHMPPKETQIEPEPVIEPVATNNEPLPPGEEPVQLNLKPALQGLTLVKQPPVLKGTELTGLCSIM